MHRLATRLDVFIVGDDVEVSSRSSVIWILPGEPSFFFNSATESPAFDADEKEKKKKVSASSVAEGAIL